MTGVLVVSVLVAHVTVLVVLGGGVEQVLVVREQVQAAHQGEVLVGLGQLDGGVLKGDQLWAGSTLRFSGIQIMEQRTK